MIEMIPSLAESAKETKSGGISTAQRKRAATLLTPDTLVRGPQDVPDCVKVSGRIINATTNLPHVITRDEQGRLDLRSRRGNSALYSAISHLDKDTEWKSILVAWTGEIEGATAAENEDDFVVSQEELKELKEKFAHATSITQVEPVWMLGKDVKRWRRYAENIIWPTLHYIQGEATNGRQENEWWEDYVRLNEVYRDRILEIYQPGDIIWIHDYYLFMLPQMLRMRLPDAFIGTFMHAPFPSSEYFRCLSKRAELLEGILGSSLVGTQSDAYTRHFISACTRLLGVESSAHHVSAFGTHVSVETHPIGIDTVKVERDAFQQSVDEKVQAIRDLYPDKKIIVGRDRLDSVRGVVQKLQAFEHFLQRYPEYAEQVVLIQVTSPGYANMATVDHKVSELVSHINGTYGMLHFAPVHHYPRHIARDEYLALLRVADLGLITSVRDGMNTTSLEFVVCQKENHSPIILSEFTGTAGSLLDAIQVNPWDATEVADTIHQCLQESNKRDNRERQQKLYRHVTTHTVQHWCTMFVSRLIHNLESHDRSHVTPMLDTVPLVQRYLTSKKRVFLFDYDGTLTPIVKEPSAAIPSSRLYETLQKLSDDPHNVVWIISGRDGAFLDKWLGDRNRKLGFSAEHGCFLKYPNSTDWHNLAESFDMSWQKVVYDVFNSYTERTQGSSIEYKRAALTWHYRRVDPDFGAFQAAHLREYLEDAVVDQYGLEVMAGKANIEVRPRQFNKGEIVKRIIKEAHDPDFVMCLGDDFTDEDMFKSLLEVQGEGIFPITVGPPSKMTVAKWHLLDPECVLDTLGLLVDNSVSGGSTTHGSQSISSGSENSSSSTATA
ncbi:hypothetical protein TRICI_003002 [Trichomonascus ciferrii]|uniref:Uncharacterized protein n=1 Tax=Trichomonascus ciferrii TaxID=44093 RepID=A0A642VB53_9ASCO|nr:hypothetical protein TRICI_003002 [Trichomonascus ciferrii]